jgi:hypothetical protein
VAAGEVVATGRCGGRGQTVAVSGVVGSTESDRRRQRDLKTLKTFEATRSKHSREKKEMVSFLILMYSSVHVSPVLTHLSVKAHHRRIYVAYICQ